MEFEIVKFKWQIKEVPEAVLVEQLQKQEENKIASAYGLCNYKTHEIWIDNGMCYEQKLQTLTHELTHCYFWSYGVRFEEYPEETICDMMYGLMLFVNAVVDEYKKEQE